VVIGEPHVVAELAERDRLPDGHVDDAIVVVPIVAGREKHVHRHGGELHRSSPGPVSVPAGQPYRLAPGLCTPRQRIGGARLAPSPY
jgi:hypothetical protein